MSRMIRAALRAGDARFHYEYIEGRTPGHEWRVADALDDVVTDFPTEEQARAYVASYNACLDPPPTPPRTWKYA